jgi:hypothetical protein
MPTIKNSRVQLKHAKEAEWILAVNFIPLEAEMIIYDIDENHNYPRFKLGDGINYVNDLPFVLP